VFTLSTESIDDLIWAADFAAEQGARLLQIHPLSEVGRASSEFVGRVPAARDQTVAWLAGLHLAQAYQGQLQIHVDLVDADALAKLSAESDEGAAEMDSVRLAELVSPLVVEDDGTVVPLEYGMDRRHALGCLLFEGLRVLARDWRTRAGGYLAFRERCRRARDAVLAGGPCVLNWYDVLRRVGSDGLSGADCMRKLS